MENALLIGLSRQTALRNQLDVIANNLANLNTTGFKSQDLAFEEYLMPVASADSFEANDQNLSYVHDYISTYNHSAGSMVQTGNPFDVAIAGKGWLVVQTPDGERYTRDGSLSLNSEGQLVTKSGYPVLATSGPMTFSPNEADITIAKDGTVSTTQGQRDRIRIVEFADESKLLNAGENLFSGDNPKDAVRAQLVQGMIERSNVKPLLEVTRMVEVTRAYQLVSAMLKEQGELKETAINQLGQADA